jgi:hypothetical protein
MISAVLAALISQIGSFIICRFVLDIGYQPFLSTNLAMIAITLLVIPGIGFLASQKVLRQSRWYFCGNLRGRSEKDAGQNQSDDISSLHAGAFRSWLRTRRITRTG